MTGVLVQRGLDLQHDRLSAPYRARLEQAGGEFWSWVQKRLAEPGLVLSSAKTANDALTLYLQHLYNIGAPIWRGVHAVLWVQTKARELRGQLRPAWDSVLTWRLSAPVRSRTPMPLAILQALVRYAGIAATVLDVGRSPIWWAFATCVQTAFFGLLRPKELYNMTRKCIRVPANNLFKTDLVVLTVLEPKNRAHMGRLQVRMVRDATAVRWITWTCAPMNGDERLWPFSAAVYKNCLLRGLSYLQLDELRLTPASGRAGGATHLLEQGVPVNVIKFAGGWASEKTLSAYLQEAESASLLLQIVPAAAIRLKEFLRVFEYASEPPPLPLAEVLWRWIRGGSSK
jgi:hypothetical protein